MLIVTMVNNNSYGQENQGQNFKILFLSETPLFMDIDSLKDATLDDRDITILTGLTDECFKKWNEKIPLKYTDGYKGDRKSEEYYKQYLAAYSKSGDKLVWINFIRKKDVKGLPERLIMITDSPFYYNCWVNLTKSKI